MRCLTKSLVLAALLAFLLPLAGIGAAEKGEEPVGDSQDEVKELQKERIEALAEIVKMRQVHRQHMATTFRDVAAAQMKLLEAKLDAADTAEERIARLEELVAVAKSVLEVTETRHRAGAVVNPTDVLEDKAAYLEVKIRLARERAKFKPQKT